MDESNEKMEFIREICKRLLKDESCNINNSLIGNGHTANVWRISKDLCLKVSTNTSTQKIPESFTKCENLCLPLRTYYSKSGKYVATLQKFLNLYTLQYLIKNRIKLSEEQSITILFDILKGLKVIHRNGFVHRDFYPGNIMLTKEEERTMAVIIDFDEMQPITPQTKACFRYNGYQAPEIVFDNAMYDDKSEMFTLGVTMWELLFGKCSFGGYDFFGRVIEDSWDKYYENSQFYNDNVKNALKSLKYYLKQKKGISSEYENLINLLLEPDRNNRITAEQALEHPIFKKILRAESRSNIKSTSDGMERE